MPHKDFIITPTTADPPTFSVADREFKALADPPGGALGDLMYAFSHKEITVRTAGLIRFIEDCLPDETVEAFRLLIHDKDSIVPVHVLADIANWLVETYTGRPTMPSPGSPAGSTSTPATSGDGADSPESTSGEPA